MDVDELQPADLAHSAGEFVDLCTAHDGAARVVAMVRTDDQRDEVDDVGDAWMGLPGHPTLLAPIGRDHQARLLVRYAAIHWNAPRLLLDTKERAICVATWGIQLVHVLEHIKAHARKGKRGLLINLLPLVDLGGHLRVSVRPTSPTDARARGVLPSDILRSWPSCDELGLVFVAGRTLSQLFIRGDDDIGLELAAITQRCLAQASRDRFSDLRALRDAFVAAGGDVSRGRDEVTWNLIEQGIGFLTLRMPQRAIESFERALERDQAAPLALTGRERAIEFMHRSQQRAPILEAHDGATGTAQSLTWTQSGARGALLEANRDFASALVAYNSTILDGTCEVHVLHGTARCHLRLGQSGQAIDHAKRVLALEPAHADALEILVRGLLMAGRHTEAFDTVEHWLASDADLATAHYLRGKALLALHRLTEARDSFGRALVADPRMVAAMLLRREADRQIVETRVTVGTQPSIDLTIPPHLPELKRLFAAGKIDDAIALLAAPRYADDPVALLLLAACLDFAGRYTEAADIYQRVAARGPEHRHAALLGRANMLVELGDPDGALDLLDALRTERPDDLDIIEGRAWVLDRLGRAEESQTEFRRYVALNQGSVRRAGWIRRQR